MVGMGTAAWTCVAWHDCGEHDYDYHAVDGLGAVLWVWLSCAFSWQGAVWGAESCIKDNAKTNEVET